MWMWITASETDAETIGRGANLNAPHGKDKTLNDGEGRDAPLFSKLQLVEWVGGPSKGVGGRKGAIS